MEILGPQHVAIIMDGNGRWAKQRGMLRIEGHRRGVESVRGVVEAAIHQKIPYLTLFSFSSENWSRPAQEVSDLMGLLKLFIRRDLARLHSNDVRVKIIGSRQGVPDDIQALLEDAEEKTKANTRLTLTVAFNYGARDEILRAVQAIARDVAQGHCTPGDITQEMISSRLDTAGLPDPDLLIRTSGEVRMSNFLLWQCAYTELVFLDIFWPEFSAKSFAEAIEIYKKRDRRYGGLKEQT